MPSYAVDNPWLRNEHIAGRVGSALSNLFGGGDALRLLQAEQIAAQRDLSQARVGTEQAQAADYQAKADETNQAAGASLSLSDLISGLPQVRTANTGPQAAALDTATAGLGLPAEPMASPGVPQSALAEIAAASVLANKGRMDQLDQLPGIIELAAGAGGLGDPVRRDTLASLFGQDYAHTQTGFTADQTRRRDEAAATDATNRYNVDQDFKASVYNTDVDASTQRRGQDVAAATSRRNNDQDNQTRVQIEGMPARPGSGGARTQRSEAGDRALSRALQEAVRAKTGLGPTSGTKSYAVSPRLTAALAQRYDELRAAGASHAQAIDGAVNAYTVGKVDEDGKKGPKRPFIGLRETPGAAPAKPAAPKPAAPARRVTPPPAAVERLKREPHLRQFFDEKYGAGSAAQVLGR